ncbi:MAG: WD40 repeat domain-containing protein [Egibacteraceae bacterium]
MLLRGREGAVSGVTWSPDGQRVVTGSHDLTARLWDPQTGSEVAILRGHEDWVWSVAWSPDGQCIATASFDRAVRLWDVQAGTDLVRLRGHEDRVIGVAWSPNAQRIVTTSRDRTVRMWDIKTGTELAIVGVHRDWAEDVAWSPNAATSQPPHAEERHVARDGETGVGRPRCGWPPRAVVGWVQIRVDGVLAFRWPDLLWFEHTFESGQRGGAV